MNSIDELKLTQKRLKAIADLLPGWTVGKNTMGHGGNIVRTSDGASIFIRFSGAGIGKGQASGSGPIDVDGQRMRLTGYGEKQPEIGFSTSKSDEQISNDIAKRLLPEYLPLYAKCLEQLTSNNQAKDNRLVTLKEIETILPTLTINANEQDVSLYGLDSDVSGYIRISYSGESGELNLRSVPKPLLLKLLKVVASEVTK